ncbi:hypothetical protein FOA52_001830 [Chlamydomonas sp. UWO 241]|nr:hypothetical protein FOA52_001830 [Chlamydomonas sp. UWO 241]
MPTPSGTQVPAAGTPTPASNATGLTTTLTVSGLVTPEDLLPVNDTFIAIAGYAMVANVGLQASGGVARDCSAAAALKSSIMSRLRLGDANVTIVCWQLRRARALLEDGGAGINGVASPGGRALAQECNPEIVMRTTLEVGSFASAPEYMAAFASLVDNEIEGACPLGAVGVSTRVLAESKGVNGCDAWTQRLTAAMPAGTTASDCAPVAAEPVAAPPAEGGAGGIELWLIVVIIVAAIFLPLVCYCVLFVLYRRKKRAQAQAEVERARLDSKVEPFASDDAPDLQSAAATDSSSHKEDTEELMEEGNSPIPSPKRRSSSGSPLSRSAPGAPAQGSPASVIDASTDRQVGLDWRRRTPTGGPSNEAEETARASASLPMPSRDLRASWRRSLPPLEAMPTSSPSSPAWRRATRRRANAAQAAARCAVLQQRF